MTNKEIGDVLNGNCVTHALVELYDLKKFFKLNYVKYPIDMSDFSTAEDYFMECVLNGIDNYAKANSHECVVGVNKNIYASYKKKYLDRFEEKDRLIMDKYWEGTIGYAYELLEGALLDMVKKYVNVRFELDKKVYDNCAIPVNKIAEAFAEKIRSDEDYCGLNQIELSKYKWASSLPGSVKYIDRRGAKYCVVLSEQPKLGNYLDLALQGEKGYHYFGNANWYINPFTYEQIFNQSIKYNKNILEGFDIKSKADIAKLEVIAEYVKENFHEVPFCKFVHLVNGLNDLKTGYVQVEKIFDKDYNNLMSDKMIKRQRKFLKIGKGDIEKLIQENIEEFQNYFNDVFYNVFERFEASADRHFSMGESPFPEFE